ncbi:MAG: LytS/YhcK type 5TM receptor domain-containing protein [Clostridiaceae bacterium]|nr:LytS/YhcK type 5TM receptor domain-containing protein [Clostridiaceae bacterium]
MAYILTRTKVYASIISAKKVTLKQTLVLIAVFGLFSIFGTLGGIDVSGAIANTRDLGPAIAGLIGGPLVGIGAGLIGGIHRFYLGGITYIPCSVSTVLAGLAGGLIYQFQFKKGKLIGITGPVIFMALFEAFHMGLALVIVKPFATILPIIESISLPMILTNSLGMGVFTFIIHNLMRERETLRTKELIESELSVAREIQMSIVPKIFPAFPERSEFDIFAMIEPAREVGGDLYDFFLLDDDHLCFTIGDVSGKGVPASLFMAVAKTLIKAKAGIHMGPDQILYQVNNELCKDNDSGMFVTIFLGILTISSGEMVFSNGGHNLPYLQKANRETEALPKIPGMALAVMEDAPYTCSKITVKTGDSLVLYTDGVTEAMNPAGDLLKDEKLVQMLRQFDGSTAKDAVRHILGETRRFVNGATQSDDITILVLKYLGSKRIVYQLNGGLEEISVLSETIEKFAAGNGIPQDIVFKVNLSIDELLTNTLSYGYPERGEREISVSLAVQDQTLVIETRDNASAFNPLEKTEPDISQDIDERPIGGLGIHIVRKMMDEIAYRREAGFNILTMKKSF